MVDDARGEPREPFLCKAPKRVLLLGVIALLAVIVAARAEPWVPEDFRPRKVEVIADVIQALVIGGGGIVLGIALAAYLAIKSNPRRLVYGAFAIGVALATCGTLAAFGYITFPLRPITAVSVGLGMLGALSGYAVALVCNSLRPEASPRAQP